EPTQEFIVEVDADLAMISAITRVEIIVYDINGLQTDSADITLDGTWPNCLPLSVGIAPRRGKENAALKIEVIAHKSDQALTKTIDTELTAGTRYVKVFYPASCLDSDCSGPIPSGEVTSVDRAETMQRIEENQTCRAAPGDVPPRECVAMGG